MSGQLKLVMAETTWDSASTVSYYLGFVSIIFRPRAPVKCSSASSASLVHCDESGVTSFSSRPLLPSYPACLPRRMTHRWHAARPAIPECSAGTCRGVCGGRMKQQLVPPPGLPESQCRFMAVSAAPLTRCMSDFFKATL